MTKYLFIALANAIIGFVLFRSLYLRTSTTWLRAALAIAAFVLAVPAALFSSNYLMEIPNGIWFTNFHSIPGIEASSGLVGALLGVVFASTKLRTRWSSILVLTIPTAAAAILMIAPFAKQILYSLDYSKLGNTWKDGICQQTSSSTCVPASCATVIKMLGGDATEQALAKEAGTTSRGTEIWYMKRALRQHGYLMESRTADALKDAPTPAILGVMVGRVGHVIVLISKSAEGPEIGDPLGPHRRYTWAAFERRYHPKQTYFVISARGIGMRTPTSP